jgi:hypothetical protein
MIGAETVAFLERGTALIFATVAADGEPRAARAWGLTVLSASGPEVEIRLLIDADDEQSAANLDATGQIAITAACVKTLRSTQLKGRATRVEPATDEDRERSARYVDAFVTDILETDRTPPEIIARHVPVRLRACTVSIGELFDQTPGPGAGARLERAAQ